MCIQFLMVFCHLCQCWKLHLSSIFFNTCHVQASTEEGLGILEVNKRWYILLEEKEIPVECNCPV